ncbi:replication initiator [Frankia sp. Cas4]|uniref:replication initiator n=1 Tax=Frankia sp. Cas4 TaxID=3073927 RepID=UPI002AD42ACF|nr:replication initiator [Frankia sp. Cas4]
MSGVDEPAVDDGDPGGVRRLAGQIRATGGCSCPVRLVGRVDQVDRTSGEIRSGYSTVAEPGGVLRVRCNNRRATVCPSCSRTYKGDARQIIVAGVSGGRKGVPDTVAGHPALFVTVTAPSFGPVHSRRVPHGGVARVCRPRRGDCVHGLPRGCLVRHNGDDPRLGEALCPDCYDYGGHVLWNTFAARLWKRTRDGVESALARAAGLSVAGLRRVVRVTFCKVAEMQARGLVHFHAVVRIDGRGEDPDDFAAPPEWATGALLADTLARVIATVELVCPDPRTVLGVTGGGTVTGGDGSVERDTDAAGAGVMVVRWGVQVDIRPIGSGGTATPDAVGNYIAKYATKSVDDGGRLDRPVRSLAQLELLGLRGHARRLVATCWRLGGWDGFAAAVDQAANRQPCGRSGLRRWAHSFGFGGHWLTKSRRYSTTFGALRAARRRYNQAGRFPDGVPRDAWGRPEVDGAVEHVGYWRFAGVGHHGDVERFLADAVRERADDCDGGTWSAGP